MDKMIIAIGAGVVVLALILFALLGKRTRRTGTEDGSAASASWLFTETNDTHGGGSDGGSSDGGSSSSDGGGGTS